MGHLLHLCDIVDKKQMHKFKGSFFNFFFHFLLFIAWPPTKTFFEQKKNYLADAEKMGKGSFAFAWAVGATEEERERGVTIGLSVNYLETENRMITLLDAPGNKFHNFPKGR